MIKRLLTALTILASLSTGYVLGTHHGFNTGKSLLNSPEFVRAAIFAAYDEGRESIVLDAIDGKLLEQKVASNE